MNAKAIGSDLCMLLVLQPSESADDYRVMHGGLQVGRVYKRKAALRADSQWLWALNGSSGGPDGLCLTGLAESLDRAQAELKGSWDQLIVSEHSQRPVGNFQFQALGEAFDGTCQHQNHRMDCACERRPSPKAGDEMSSSTRGMVHRDGDDRTC
jgi:hypothetical protein